MVENDDIDVEIIQCLINTLIVSIFCAKYPEYFSENNYALIWWI